MNGRIIELALIPLEVNCSRGVGGNVNPKAFQSSRARRGQGDKKWRATGVFPMSEVERSLKLIKRNFTRLLNGQGVDFKTSKSARVQNSAAVQRKGNWLVGGWNWTGWN